ncbi:MAG: helix-turn-helix domain-containing protein [Gemmatimonadaceae bacterium]
MSVIATLQSQPARIQRLRVAIRDRHELVVCADWQAVADACERRAVRIAILDLYAEGQANFEAIRQLKQRCPQLAIIMYGAVSLERIHDVFDAGRVGVDALVVPDQDDTPRQLLASVERAESRSLGAVVRQSLDEVDPSVRDAMLLAITRAHERLSPTGLAELLALPRRTVSDRLAAGGYPPPRRLLTWGRLIVAAHMLEDPHRTADRVAESLSFPSGSAFRNICQRYLHSTPGEIRRRGGAAFVVRSLLLQVQQAKEAGGGRRPSARVTEVLV